MVKLGNSRLTLFLSYGGSLQGWYEAGVIEREMAIYHRLLDSLGGLDLFSYGTSNEEHFHCNRYNNCRALIWPFQKGRRFHDRLGPLLHCRSLTTSSVFKTNQINGSMAAVRAKKLYGKPLVVRCGYLLSANAKREGDSGPDLIRKVEYERTCFKAADLCIVTTKRDKSEIVDAYGIDAQSVRVIPNYVNTDIYTLKPTPSKVPGSLVFVGRLSKEKNLFSLLNAVERVNNINKLTIVGDGPLREELEKRSLKIKTDVTFLGRRQSAEIPAIIAAHDIFVICSHYEGMPKALIEAMSLGMPCLGTDVRGIRDIIRHKNNGLLCHTSVEGIAAGLDTLANQPILCERLGAIAKKDATFTYGIEAITTLGLDVIAEAIEKTK